MPAVPFELRLALRHLASRRREGPVAAVTLLCTLGVTVGVAALVLALALMNGLESDLRQRLLASNPHVVVRSAWGAAPYGPAEAAAVTEVALGLADVTAAALFRAEFGLLRGGEGRAARPVSLKAVVPDAEDRVTGLRAQTTELAWERLVEDHAAALAREARQQDGAGFPADAEAPLTADELAPESPPVVLVGESLAMEMGIGAGDVVHLTVGSAELSVFGPVPRSRALVVGGLLRTGLHEYDASWGVVSFARFAPGGSAEGVQLALADPMESPDLASDLAARLGPSHQVTDWTTTFSRLFAAFRWERLIMILALGLIGLVAGFNIFTILSMNVMARVADIGILAAMGATSRSILGIFVAMGLGLGLAGTSLGLAVGAGLAATLDRFELVSLDPSVYLVSHVPFRVEAADLGVTGALMLAVTALATILPARAAARLDPVAALRAGG